MADRRKGRIWPGLLLAAVVLLVGVRVLLPWALRNVAVHQLEEVLDARVGFANLDLSLLTGELLLEGVSIAPSEDPGEPRLRAERIRLRLARRLLLEGRFAIAVLGIDGLEAVLERDAEGNLELGIEGFASDTEVEMEAELAVDSGDPLLLGRIELRDARVRIRDGERETRVVLGSASLGRLELGGEAGWRLDGFVIEELEARLPLGPEGLELHGALSGGAIDAALAGATPIELALRHDTGRLTARGIVTPQPPGADLELAWEELDAGALLAAFAPDARVRLAGRASGEAHLELLASASGSEGGELRLGGRLVAPDGEVVLPGSLDSRWKLLELELAEARVPLAGGPPTLRFDRLNWQSPVLRWTLAAASADAGASASGGAPPPQIEIATLEVDDGLLSVVDAAASGAEFALASTRLRASNLRSGRRQVEGLELDAAGPRGGALRARGRIGASDGSLDLSAKRVGLGSLARFVAARTPYRITRGEASFDARISLDAEGYDAPTHLVVHDFGLETTDEGSLFVERFGMQPQLAIGLLRDTKRDITLDLPLAGRRGGTRVDLRSVLLQALREAILNALQKPLAMLGKVVVREGRLVDFDLAGVGFRAGLAEPDSGGAARLARAAEVLAAHPSLDVELVALLVAEDARALGGAPSSDALRGLASARVAAIRTVLEAAGVAGSRIRAREGPLALGAGAPRVELVLDPAANGSP